MPKNKKNDYLKAYTYKPSKTRKKALKKVTPHKFFTSFLVLACFITIVFFANIFSSYITPGAVNVERGEKLFSSKHIYAVELASFDNMVEASEASDIFKQQLAAGYIINDSGTYRVVASAYKTRANAESVLHNLLESEINAKVLVITMPSLYLDLDLTDEQVSALKSAFEMFYNTYSSLYNLSIQLDKGEITLENCNLEVLQLKADCQATINNFNAQVTVPKYSEIIYTKIYLNTFIDNLTELINTSQASSEYSSKLKETYFKIIYGYINLKTELAKN
jgi:hypothetical protein